MRADACIPLPDERKKPIVHALRDCSFLTFGVSLAAAPRLRGRVRGRYGTKPAFAEFDSLLNRNAPGAARIGDIRVRIVHRRRELRTESLSACRIDEDARARSTICKVEIAGRREREIRLIT